MRVDLPIDSARYSDTDTATIDAADSDIATYPDDDSETHTDTRSDGVTDKDTGDTTSLCPEAAPNPPSRCETLGIECAYERVVCVCEQGAFNRRWQCKEAAADTQDTGSDELFLNSPESGSSRVSSDPNLSVTVSDARGRALDVTFYGREKDPAPWTLIALPDTQYLSKSYPDTFTSQTQWIVDQRDTLNVQMVMHEGDVVEDWNDTVQWQRADASMSLIIDADIPLTLAPGDRDHEDQDPDGATTFYQSTFPASRFRNDPWWGESYGDNTNNYALLTIGGDDYLFMALDFCPSDDEIIWAGSVLDDHADYKAVLSTHAFINENGEYSDAYSTLGADCSRFGGDTSFIWEDLIKAHDNLQLVLCGHMHLDDGELHRTVDNSSGLPVHQLLANYQMWSNGGDGRLRIMTFNPVDDAIEVETYSPYTDSYETDEDSRFTLSYEMNEFRELGNIGDVQSGSDAEIEWSGRSPKTTYEWYVVVSNGSDLITSDTWEFTTRQ